MMSLEEQIKALGNKQSTGKSVEEKMFFGGYWNAIHDVLKLLAPLMAHLQTFPELVNYKTNIIWKMALETWKEELDKLVKGVKK